MVAGPNTQIQTPEGAGPHGIAPMNTSTWKSIGAVVAGVLTIVICSTAVDVALHTVGVFPPLGTPIDDKMSVLATIYRVIISTGGAWLTAKLAPSQPMKHVVALGIVGTVLGTLGVVATWGKGMSPTWYPIALAVLALPQCWLGGKLFERRAQSEAP